MQSLQRRNTYHCEAHHGRDSQQDQETYSGLRSDIARTDQEPTEGHEADDEDQF